MPTRRTEDFYRDFVVDQGLERAALLELLRVTVGEAAPVLYPGCFVHLTPSFFFQHVVYVDRSDVAQGFFADEEGVRRLINANRRYRQSPFVRFVAQDFTTDLPVAESSFELLLSLYAGGISRACARYLRVGGLLVSNDHLGDAAEASALSSMSLVAVIKESRGRVRFIDRDLDGYLSAPKSLVRSGRAPGGSRRKYQRTAEYYVFRKARG